MKKNLFFGLLILFCQSCEKKDRDVFFKIGTGLEYSISDIELYDTSTHIMYFKAEHDEFDQLEKGTFTFQDNGEPIYTGSLLPGYSSSIPSGPFIMTLPSMYGNHALRIDCWRTDKPDSRDDSRLIQVLNKHGLLHSGLAISAVTINLTGSQLVFKFTISNHDQSDLLIIDPDKTGPGLFHYFSNGLQIYDKDNKEVFSGNIQHLAPDPWNSWKTEWLSALKSGDSKDFTITYPFSSSLVQGDYKATFRFPGLAYQVSKDQLYQSNGRIWLGDVSLVRRIQVRPDGIVNK